MKIRSQFEKYINIYSTDETQAKAMKVGFLFTGIIWFVLLIVLAVLPGLQVKKKYKTVRIILEPAVQKSADKEISSFSSSTGASEIKSEPKIAKQQNPAPSASAAPAQKKTETSNKNAQTQKSSTKTAASDSVQKNKTSGERKKAVIKYAKSVDELLGEQQNSSAKKNVDWDSLDFAENTSGSSSATASEKVQSLENSSALSGYAATKTDSDGGISTVGKKTSSGTNASSETSALLKGVKNSTYSSSAANGLKSQISVGTSSDSSGKFSLAMTDGSSRILLDPAEPFIAISEEAAALIDSTRNVSITFRILPQGNVPLNAIAISPSSSLPLEVQSEIKAQISKWRFASALTDGQARFDYSIIKR